MIRLLNVLKNNWIPFSLFFLAVITALSLWPLKNLPPVPGSDKIHHMIAYAILMLPTALRKPRHWKFIGVFFIAYSGGIELVQPYVNRYGQWLDLAANIAGLACGFIFAKVITFLFPIQEHSDP